MTDLLAPRSAAAVPQDPETPPRRGFSHVLRELADSGAERVSIGSILHAFGDRAYGALLLVFALPNALPMPPGTSTVLGAPLVFIAFQLMIGRPVLWLPKFVTQRSLRGADFKTIADKIEPWIVKFERLLKQRGVFMTTVVADRLTGAACLLLTVILVLPIPLGNMPPAFAISAFGLGLIERDGLAIGVGWGATAISLCILAALGTAITAAAHAFAGPVLRLFGL